MPASQIPEKDAGDKLVALGVAQSTEVYQGPVQPAGGGIPAKAVFLTDTTPTFAMDERTGEEGSKHGGRPPETYLGAGSDFRRASVQVIVRGAVNDYSGGRTFAQSVWEGLHRASITGYVYCEALNDRFVWFEQEAGGSHKWKCNFELAYEY